MKRLIALAVGGIVALLALSWVGIYVYIHFLKADPPERLSFDTLDAATTLAVPASSGGTALNCSAVSFESGRAVIVVTDSGKPVDLESTAMSGEVTVCDGQVSAGTVDIDVSSAAAASDSATSGETASARAALQADEFPILSLTLTGPDRAIVQVAGTERDVPVTVKQDGSAVTVRVDLTS